MNMSTDATRQLLLKPEEAAELLAVGRTRVYELIGSGALESVKIGRLRRVPYAAVVRFVEALERPDQAGTAVSSTGVRAWGA